MTATAAILVGGLGTRLREVVSDVPKVLAPVAGRPFLDYLLQDLRLAGIQRVVLCTCYMAEQIEALYGQGWQGLEIAYSREEEPLGTGGALRKALGLFMEEEILILNGDSRCTLDLPSYQAWHKKQQAEASIALVHLADTARYGKVLFDDSGRIGEFREKTGEASPGWVNAGIYLISRDLIASLPGSVQLSIEREIFPEWVNEGRLFCYAAPDAEFIDIGTPQSFKRAQTMWRAREERRGSSGSYDAVLFDFDGVLADTLGDNHRAWEAAFDRFGGKIDREEYFAMEGRRSNEMVPHFLKKSGLPVELTDEIIRIKNEYYAANNEFRLYDGVEDLLAELRTAGIKIALVSGGSKARLMSPPSDSILPLFDTVILGDDCEKTKPDPEPYLSAARRLGVEPSRCVVVENAPLGIAAAKAAGMFCVALKSTLGESYLVEASCVVSGVEELRDWLMTSVAALTT